MTLPAAIHIRPLVPGDVPVVHTIVMLSIYPPWSQPALEAELQHSYTLARVAQSPAGVVGFMLAWHLQEEAQIVMVAVHPLARGQGIGRELVRSILQTLLDDGVATIFLEVRDGNHAARALYSQLGFHITGRRPGYYDNPTEDAILMTYSHDAGGSHEECI